MRPRPVRARRRGPSGPQAILFDLDDTLYPRRRFVLSGFRAVGAHLARTEGLDADRIFAFLMRASRGPRRGRELQACLARYGLPQAIAGDLVEVIRAHEPSIRLPLASRRAIALLRQDWRLGVVTNGLAGVQARKVEALGLRRLVDTVVFAVEHGAHLGKPERAPFAAALRNLDVPPSRAIFVGDDERCDLYGAARAGLRTVFFGGYRRGSCDRPRYADAVVGVLAEVPDAAARLLLEPGGVMSLDRAAALPIGSRLVGAGQPLYVIAEIGLNHGGSIDRALAMVDAAAAAGASAVKLQTLTAAELVGPACPPPAHVTHAESLQDFFAAFELSEQAHCAIAARVRSHGLGLLATPLSLGAVDLLERVGIDAYKIASGDIVWDDLVRRCAGTGRPLVISTGMASLDEAAHAVACARSNGAAGVALLHCVSAYPNPPGSENLRAIPTLARAFDVPVGLSDHGADELAVPLAVALGASLYERHLVLDGDDGAVDAAVSSTPARLAAAVAAAARAAEALGSGEKTCLPAEAVNVSASRRSLCARRRLRAGHILQSEDLIALRPATGLAPARAAELVGRRLARDVEAGSALLEEDISCHAESNRDRGVA